MNRHDFDPGPLAATHTIAEGERWTVVFVRHLPHAPAAVWGALTDARPDRVVGAVHGRPRPGEAGPATLTMMDGDDAADSTPAEVTQCEPPSLLEYTWGPDLLRWELAPDGDGTLLTLRHTMDDREWLPKTAAGWHLCLAVADHLLAGDPIGPIRGQDAKEWGWDELNEAYSAVLLD